MVSRMELDKLALYAAGQSEITLEDAQAVIGDAAAVTSGRCGFRSSRRKPEGIDGRVGAGTV